MGATGLLAQVDAAPSLGQSHGVLPGAITIGVPGDGRPEMQYDPFTGHVFFRTDGGSFTTTGGSPSFVCSLILRSDAGILNANGASVALQSSTGFTADPHLISGSLTFMPGFTDDFDLGQVLPPSVWGQVLLRDLMFNYQTLNGGALRSVTAVGLLGLPPPADIYTGPTGTWSNGTNWSLTTLPDLRGPAVVQSTSGPLTVNFDIASAQVASLQLTASGSNSITLQQTQGSLITPLGMQLGTLAGDQVIVNQSGGSNNLGELTIGTGAGASALYHLGGTAALSIKQLTIGAGGVLQASAGNVVALTGDFHSASNQSANWDTHLATLHIQAGGSSSAHVLDIDGVDLGGGTLAGYSNNFAWGTLQVDLRQTITLTDGAAPAGGALYLKVFQITDPPPAAALMDYIAAHVLNADAANPMDIYYDPTQPANSYLGGQTFALGNGGVLAPAVPEPAGAAWAGLVLAGGGLLRRRKAMRRSANPS
jgi:hypothetical protein